MKLSFIAGPHHAKVEVPNRAGGCGLEEVQREVLLQGRPVCKGCSVGSQQIARDKADEDNGKREGHSCSLDKEWPQCEEAAETGCLHLLSHPETRHDLCTESMGRLKPLRR